MFSPSAEDLGILALSLRVAVVSVICSLPVAILVAYVLARVSFRGKTLFDAIVHLPLVLPPVVVGFALLVLFGKHGPLGSLLDEWFGIVFAFRWTGAALASAIMGFPLMVRAIRLSISAIDRRLEVAARTLGGSRPWVFASITLPLALPGIITGTLLSFARGLGEFGATITFVSNIPGETRTLPLAIYSALQVPGGEAMVTRLAGGDLSAEVDRKRGGDEIGQMAEALSVFREGIVQANAAAAEKAAEQEAKQRQAALIDQLTREFNDGATNALAAVSTAA